LAEKLSLTHTVRVKCNAKRNGYFLLWRRDWEMWIWCHIHRFYVITINLLVCWLCSVYAQDL